MPSLFLSVQHRVEGGVVVHLHLFVGLHVLTPGLDVGDQFFDGRREILLLREEHIELFLASVAMTSDDKEYCSDILWRLSSLHPTGEDYDYFKTFSDSLAAYCAG